MLTLLSALGSLIPFQVRSRAALELELVALRHQLTVLRRQRPSQSLLISAPSLSPLPHFSASTRWTSRPNPPVKAPGLHLHDVGRNTPLRIPYGNKEVAQKLGARYGADGWYAPPGVDLSKIGRRAILSDSRNPVIGTRLLREWDGVEHTVTVTKDGYEFEGRRYKSLSAIARIVEGRCGSDRSPARSGAAASRAGHSWR